MSDIKTWIIENCFTKSKTFNNRVNIETWWKNKNANEQLENINLLTRSLNISNISQKIWHILNNINEIPKCYCGANTKFKQFKKGYTEYCSRKCALHGTSRIEKIINHPNYKIAKLKAKETNIKKYGFESPFSNTSFQLSVQAAKINKYGCMNPSYEKIKLTNKNKYGTEYYFQTKEFKEKAIKSKLDKYGTLCFFSGKKSQAEEDIRLFLNSLGYTFKKTNNILPSGLELDGYCEEKKMAFEYCGLYWHSELIKSDKKYHFKKYNECKQLGIELITIFEDEWLSRKEQVKQFLKSKLGIFENRIYARNCEFLKIDKNHINFFHNYHIQGIPNRSDYLFGLKYNNELVGAISFGKHHRNIEKMTINRVAFIDKYQIIGGGSKLFKNSLKHIKENTIITWSDNRWTNGNFYDKLGFMLDGNLPPDYSYIKSSTNLCRWSKQSQKKSNTGCPNNITESEWAHKNGFYKIYDCGKKRWIYNKEN